MKRLCVVLLVLWILIGGLGLQFTQEAKSGSVPPQVLNVRLNGQPSQIFVFSAVPILTLTATIDDSSTGGSLIVGANYTIGPANWPGIPMNATDGSFDNMTEDVTATVANPGVAGSWRYCVYGMDEAGNFDIITENCADLTIQDDAAPAVSLVAINGLPFQTYSLSSVPLLTLTARIDDSATGNSKIIGANYTIGPQNWPGFPMSPSDGFFDGPIEDVNTTIPNPGQNGSWSYCVYGEDEFGNSDTTGGVCANLAIQDDLPPIVSSVLLDGQPVLGILVGTPSVVLTANLDDGSTGNSDIKNASYYTNPPWQTGPMDLTNPPTSPIEDFNITLATDGLPTGAYQACVVGADIFNNLASPVCADLTVSVPDSQPPEILNVLLNGQPSPSYGLSAVPILTLTGTVDDSTTGNSIIGGANFTVGPGNWPGIMMPPTDGAFDEPTEDVTATISNPGLTGFWRFCIYGWDVIPNYNTLGSCASLDIFDDLAPDVMNVLLNGMPSVAVIEGSVVTLTATGDDSSRGNSNISHMNYTIGPINWTSSTPMAATDGIFDEPTEGATVGIDTTGWPIGIHTICVNAMDDSGNRNDSCLNFATLDVLPADTTPPLIANVLVNGFSVIGVVAGNVVMLTATINDVLTGDSDILGANFTIGSGNWPGTPMSPTDGLYNTSVEDVFAPIDTTGWPLGPYEIWVYGCDANFNCNIVGNFATINIVAESIPPLISGVLLNGLSSQTYGLSAVPTLTLRATVDDSATGNNNITGANYTIGPFNWPGTPMIAIDGFFDEVAEVVSAIIPNPGMAGFWSFCVYGSDQAGNGNTTSTECADLTILDDIPPSVALVGINGQQSQTYYVSAIPILTLTAYVHDSGTGNSIITEANYTIDPFNWPGTAMFASDGSFDEIGENATATIPSPGIAGFWRFCVYGSDQAGNGNTTSTLCADLTILDDMPPFISWVDLNGQPFQSYGLSAVPTLTLNATVDDRGAGDSNINGANYTIGSANWPGIAMIASDGSFDEVNENATITIPNPGITGAWMFCVYGSDLAGNDNTTGSCATLVIFDDMPPRVAFVTLDGQSSLDIVIGTSSIWLNATLDDSLWGVSDIQNASYYTDPMGPSGPMNLVNPPTSTIEDFTETSVPTAGLMTGSYQVCVVGADDDGNLAIPSCADLTVLPPPDNQPPEIFAVDLDPAVVHLSSPQTTVQLTATIDDNSTGKSTIAMAEYTVDGGPPTNMEAQDGTFDETVENVTADIPITLAVRQYLICVYGIDSEDNANTTGSCVQLSVEDDVEPTAAFTFGPEEPTVGEETTLNATESNDADSNIASFDWTITDPELNEETLTGEVATHTFDMGGEYTIVLTVTDEWGNWATTERTVTVASIAPTEIAPEVVVGGAGIAIGVGLFIASLLFYYVPSAAVIGAKAAAIKPFSAAAYGKVSKSLGSVVATKKGSKILVEIRTGLTESAGPMDQTDALTESLEEVG
jgi:hypothetical protein